MKAQIQRMVDDLYDNGTPGCIPRMESFMSEHNGASKEQEKMHQQNLEKLNRQSTKLNWILAITAIAALIVSIVGLIVGNEVVKRGSINLHSSNQPAIAEYHAKDE